MRFHQLVGWASVLLASAHLAAVTLGGGGHLGGLWVIGLAVLAPGLCMALTRFHVASVLVLLGVCIAQLAAFHATFPAILAVAALADCIVLAVVHARAGRAAVAVALIMCTCVGGLSAMAAVTMGVTR